MKCPICHGPGFYFHKDDYCGIVKYRCPCNGGWMPEEQLEKITGCKSIEEFLKLMEKKETKMWNGFLMFFRGITDKESREMAGIFLGMITFAVVIVLIATLICHLI